MCIKARTYPLLILGQCADVYMHRGSSLPSFDMCEDVYMHQGQNLPSSDIGTCVKICICIKARTYPLLILGQCEDVYMYQGQKPTLF